MRSLGLMLCVWLAGGVSVFAEDRTRPTLSAIVFDYAGASPILPDVFRETERILARSDVKFAFVLCPGRPDAIAANPRCAREPQRSAILIDLLRANATRRATEPNAFGYAGRDGAPYPWFAGVFYDRVEELSRTDRVRCASILAAVMAHEIGHILLGADAHSSSGIMAAHWSAKELLEIERGQLAFSRAQLGRISAAAQARDGPDATLYARAAPAER